MEGKPSRRSCGAEIMKDGETEPYKRYELGITNEKSCKGNHGREIMKDKSWRSNRGGAIMEEELWRRSHGGEIITEIIG